MRTLQGEADAKPLCTAMGPLAAYGKSRSCVPAVPPMVPVVPVVPALGSSPAGKKRSFEETAS